MCKAVKFLSEKDSNAYRNLLYISDRLSFDSNMKLSIFDHRGIIHLHDLINWLNPHLRMVLKYGEYMHLKRYKIHMKFCKYILGVKTNPKL